MANSMASYCFKPCEYIGKCIDKGCECGCRACGAACSAPCAAFGQCCCPPDKPSPIFLTYSVAVCGIPAVMALLGMTSAKNCGDNVKVYLGVMLALNIALIAFAMYLYHRFSQVRVYRAYATCTDVHTAYKQRRVRVCRACAICTDTHTAYKQRGVCVYRAYAICIDIHIA